MMIYIYMHIANMLHEIHTYVIANIYTKRKLIKVVMR